MTRLPLESLFVLWKPKLFYFLFQNSIYCALNIFHNVGQFHSVYISNQMDAVACVVCFTNLRSLTTVDGVTPWILLAAAI